MTPTLLLLEQLALIAPWLIAIVLPLVFLSALTNEHIAKTGSVREWRKQGGIMNLGLDLGKTGFMMEITSTLRVPFITLLVALGFMFIFSFVTLHSFRYDKPNACFMSGFVLLFLGFGWATIWLPAPQAILNNLLLMFTS